MTDKPLTASDMGKRSRANFFKNMTEEEKRAYLRKIASKPRKKRKDRVIVLR